MPMYIKKIFNGNAWYIKWTFFTTIMYLAQNIFFLNTNPPLYQHMLNRQILYVTKQKYTPCN
jgi:hypothetical protein